MHARPGRLVLALAVVLVVALVLAPTAFSAGAPVRKIVIYKSGFLNAKALDALKRHGGTQIKQLDLIDGACVYLPSEAAARAIASEAGVLRVENDVKVSALAKPAGGTSAPAPQVTPWGIDRIGADHLWTLTTGDPVKVGIIDTGIDYSHPDLAANVKGGVSYVSYTASYKDDNGHGTHVAGITAALDNTQGVVGAAPAADLYAIKVLDRRGSGYVSDIVLGLDWAIANGMQVVNMSLGASAYSSALDLAVQRANTAGIVQVAAAGNSGPGANTVSYPGALPQCIAVAATDSSNTVAYWSSRGPQVAVSAPGVSIYSTYKGGKYTTLSGTSMASPHVAGTVALMLTQPVGTADANGNGRWDPAEVKAKLKATALDLGTPGFDTSYGSGLVQAGAAIAP